MSRLTARPGRGCLPSPSARHRPAPKTSSSPRTTGPCTSPTRPPILGIRIARVLVRNTRPACCGCRAPTPRATPAEIKEASERYGVPERAGVSGHPGRIGLQPAAVSVKGAQGLMQLMPETASMLGVRNSLRPAAEHRRRRAAPARADRAVREQPAPGARGLQRGREAVAVVRRDPAVPGDPRLRGARAHALRRRHQRGGEPACGRMYRTVGDDGSIVYTNIPPRGRR